MLKIENFWESYLGNVAARQVRDIHLELHESGFLLRERIPSGLVVVDSGERIAGNQLLAAICYKAGLDARDEILEGRLLTDSAEFRLSIIPTEAGRSCVLRVLPLGGDTQKGFPEADFSVAQRKVLEHGLTSQRGWILICGPTGSGKTTTLYYLLSQLNTGDKKIITVEDPVEQAIPGIVQTEVRAKQNWPMAGALRRILRHDPDVIMLGEIRDRETAEIASRAALTGHKVLSTIHSADALGVVDRLRDLGVSNALLGEIMELSIAQRLLPRNCVHCREPCVETAASKSLGELFVGAMIGKGCHNCAFRGLAGTVMLAEILNWSAKLRQSTQLGEPRTELMGVISQQEFNGLPAQIIARLTKGDISPAVGLNCLRSLPDYKYSRHRGWF